MASFQFQKLDVYVAARQLAVIVQQARIRDAELNDQATRAAKSCFLNLSEGLPSDQAGVRKRHFAIARGSLAEVAAALDLASALGAIDSEIAHDASNAIARVASMLAALRRRA
ncbi:MAG: four helix bundle protein [Polyangiaceae bacterium]